MRQVMECFEGRSVRAYVDGTMGAGGHASAMVRAHPEMRAFVGFDVDPAAHALARPRLEAAARSAGREDGATRLHFQLANFRDMRVELEALQLRGQLDGVLLDLGVSSMHLDTPAGFSFNDGQLDMRMGPGAALTAEALVNDGEDEIARVLRDYGEERHWRLLARRICDVRAARPIRTTRELVAALRAGPRGEQAGPVRERPPRDAGVPGDPNRR